VAIYGNMSVVSTYRVAIWVRWQTEL